MKKICFKCWEEKDLSEYYIHKQMGDGHLNKCKECTKKDTKSRSVDKREYVKAYDTMRYRTNIKRLKWHKYRGIVSRCTGGHKNRKYYVEGMEYLTEEQYEKWWKDNKLDFEKCYKVWENSGFKNKFAPSIDRINSNKGYIPDNMQWLVFSVNCKKYNK